MEDKHFIDWEGHVFGFGYGTGEPHTLKALKQFFSLLENDHSYDHSVLEKEMGPTIAWLMINILAHADLLEYGTSPRYGWLTDKGTALNEYLKSKTTEQLYELVMVDSDYVHCYPEHCNCGPDGYSKEKICHNPLFIN